jgi:hypothetical protein
MLTKKVDIFFEKIYIVANRDEKFSPVPTWDHAVFAGS